MLNLALAIFWLVVLIVLLATGAEVNILRTGIPFAWLAALFCGYNLVRWLVFWQQKRTRDADRQLGESRANTEKRNPEFDFSDQPDANGS